MEAVNQMNYQTMRDAGVPEAIALKAAVSIDLLSDQEADIMQNCFDERLRQMKSRAKDIQAIIQEHNLTL